MGFLHLVGLFCILAATVLLVIASVSVPVWDRIEFLKADNGRLLAGVWGAATPQGDSVRRLGYEITVNGRVVIHKAISYALILNPIAAGFSFIALLAALGSNTACGIFASILAAWAFLVTLVALAIDLAVFVMARNRLNEQVPGSAKLGKALWFVVAACGALLLASVTVCFTRSSNRHHERDAETRALNNDGVAYGQQPARRGFFGRRNQTPVVSNAPPMQERRRFWQRKQQPVY